MAKLLNVAAYILEKAGPMTAMKLQKLVYYSQAWHLVWEERPLFTARIEAWANGPVAPLLYRQHRGAFRVTMGDVAGDRTSLKAPEKTSIDAVLEFYGDKPAVWLSTLTHREAPWKDARKGLDPGERGNVQITQAAMREYYESLVD